MFRAGATSPAGQATVWTNNYDGCGCVSNRVAYSMEYSSHMFTAEENSVTRFIFASFFSCLR